MASKRFSGKEILSLLSGLPRMEAARYHFSHVGKTVGVRNVLRMANPLLVGKILAAGWKNALPTLLFAMLEKNDTSEAIVSGSTRLTHAQLADRVRRFANWLVDHGVQPKDRVATLLLNSHPVIETLFAGSLCGCPCPGVNWHLAGKELVKTINITKPKVLVLGSEFVERIAEIRSEIPSVQYFLVAEGPIPEGMLSYQEAVTYGKTELPRDRFILGISPYTSGTTGIPKSVNMYDGVSFLFDENAEKPRANLSDYVELLVKMLNAGFYLDLHKIKDMRSLIVTPLYHAGTIAGLLPALYGGTLVLLSRFEPENILKTIQDERISWSFMVPTMLKRLVSLPPEIQNKYDLSSMVSLISAAAPCAPELKKQVNELFARRGAKSPVFHEYYGSSETMIVTVLNPEDYAEKPERINSVGKIRCGDLLVVDPMKNAEVPVGESGSICVRTVSTLSLNYGGDSQSLLNKSYCTVNGRDYYIDGVIGYRDADGFLYLTDRIKDMVISGGVNVFPGHVESALMEHPAVDDVAVFGVPDPDLGEVMRAEIQLKKGKKLTEKQVLDYLKTKDLFGYKLPKYVGFTDKLPRRIDGKMMKRELKAKYWPEGTRG
ncbi:MAG: AMP-binding protein [Thermodesulfobacteriota bacterium]